MAPKELWWARRGSNPHGPQAGHWILSPERLPIPPLAHCLVSHYFLRTYDLSLSGHQRVLKRL